MIAVRERLRKDLENPTCSNVLLHSDQTWLLTYFCEKEHRTRKICHFFVHRKLIHSRLTENRYQKAAVVLIPILLWYQVISFGSAYWFALHSGSGSSSEKTLDSVASLSSAVKGSLAVQLRQSSRRFCTGISLIHEGHTLSPQHAEHSLHLDSRYLAMVRSVECLKWT